MYAVTWHIWQQILREFPCSTFHHVIPPGNWAGMLASRLRRRVLGLRGRFYPFAPSVLTSTRLQVETAVQAGADALLFRSGPRWIHCRPDIPYFVHTDACFHTYCRNKNAESEFDCTDLKRIWDKEAEFLEAANGVFFESRWALENAVSAYGLRGKHYHVVGVAGALPAPAANNDADNLETLLSIANHFRQKGGDLIFDAFRLLRPRFPYLKWHIVGGQPDRGIVKTPGIFYDGPLNPQLATDLQKYTSLLAASSLLLHPTREDMNPLVLLEAAGYGCPAITVNDFAIPELVEHGKTGVLLERPITPASLANAVECLILNPHLYRQMRVAARESANRRASWDKIGNHIASLIGEVLGVLR